jgi:ArsR family transcriptional regulator, arsenate/arsenite/antimonite-responsive transcriptional repressor
MTMMEKMGAIAALGALAQETRLDVFRLLVTQGPTGLPAGVIAERLDVLPASLTFHLKELHYAGLITQRRLGRQLIYAAEYGAMTELLAYLTENCCGRGETCAPVYDPADAFKRGESDETLPRSCVG